VLRDHTEGPPPPFPEGFLHSSRAGGLVSSTDDALVLVTFVRVVLRVALSVVPGRFPPLLAIEEFLLCIQLYIFRPLASSAFFQHPLFVHSSVPSFDII